MTPPEKSREYRLDTTDGATRSRFEVVARPEAVFDVMLALWSALGGDDKVKEHEVGRKFFVEFRKAIPVETVAQMREAGLDNGAMWATLLTYVATGAPVGSDEDILAWLEADDTDIAGELLREMAWSADPEDVAEALDSRDPERLAHVLPSVKEHARDCVGIALSVPVGNLGPITAQVLRSVMATAYAPFVEAWSRAISASANSTRLLAPTMDPHDLIERTTNGLAYQIPLGTRRLIMIPTVTLRPWTLITDFGDAIVVAHAVSDDHMDRDPDAAPGWLVRFHKALGDERRLRILKEVADGGAGLSQLTEVLGLAKSTVFHHIGILRAAGLVRVVFGQGEDGINVYHLRREVFGDAGVQLQKYLDIVIHEGTRP